MTSLNPNAQRKNSRRGMAEATTHVLLALLCLGLSLPLSAQEIALTGRVVDPDGKALPQATVQLIDRDRVVGRATTGLDGLFQIVMPSAGQFVIRVEASGFRQVEQPVNLALSSHSL